MLRLNATHRRWPLSRPFRISRGVKTAADAVILEASDGRAAGYGEAIPYPRYGETVEGVLEQIRALGDVRGRRQLLSLLPPGAARNAIDCALWDLEAKAGRAPPESIATAPLPIAFTVGLDAPEVMAEAARPLAGFKWVKVKVDAVDPETQILAVRSALPDAELIVDPNESWSFDVLRRLQGLLASARVSLVEQPLPASEDEALEGFQSTVPLCADESCHVAEDLPRLRARYQAVNIKLDKTGGLTAAFDLYAAARAHGFGVMVGCMICSSLSIAPAMALARRADFVDLDGPLWLAEDWPNGVRLDGGLLLPPAPELWGSRG